MTAATDMEPSQPASATDTGSAREYARRVLERGLVALRWRALEGPRRAREREEWKRQGVHLGEATELPTHSRVAAPLTVGHHVAFAGPVTVKGPGNVEPRPGVTIGAYSAIGESFSAITDSHRTTGPNIEKGLHRRHGFREIGDGAPILIGAGCWVGDRVIVLPGAVVGAGAVLAAGAVVRGNVEPYTVVGGVPARRISRRCAPEVADALVDLAWWDWPEERIARSRGFFECDISKVTVNELRALAATG